MKKNIITIETIFKGKTNVLVANKSTAVADPNMQVLNQLSAISGITDLNGLIDWINTNLINNVNITNNVLNSTRTAIKDKLTADRNSGQQNTI